MRTVQARDTARGRLFPCEIWYPAAAAHAGGDMAPEKRDSFAIRSGDNPRSQDAVRDAAARPEAFPLILFSHPSGGHRRSATFLCTHLGSRGYVVAALDHSEGIAAELARRDGETDAQKAARQKAVITNRVPDLRFLLDLLLGGGAGDDIGLDPSRVGIVGHSLGGWTALAATAVDPRIRAVVALAPGGSVRVKPGILPVTLDFRWDRVVPALYLAAENDVSLPLDGMFELFDRAPAPKQMVMLRRADHLHFMDNVEEVHETVRTMPWTGELDWIPKEMRSMTELCSGEQAHVFTRGLTLGHMDATLRGLKEARRFLAGDLEAELAARGVDAVVHRP